MLFKNLAELGDEQNKEIDRIAKEFFGTETDPEQIQINPDTDKKLLNITPNTVICSFDDKRKPKGWVVVLPTQKENARRFIQGGITEKELLDYTDTSLPYDALYLCAAFVLPEYRRKGLSEALMTEAIKRNVYKEDILYFAWPYSEEGRLLVGKLELALGVKIELRKVK